MTAITKHGLEAVLIDSDARSRDAMSSYLASQGIRVAGAAGSLAEGLHLARSIRQGILLLELPANPSEELEAVRRLRAELPHLGLVVSSTEVSPQLILRSMRAGAHEFLPRPVDLREFGETLGRLAGSLTPTAGYSAAGGRIFTLFSAKGGTGVTSIATNIAVALAKGGAKTVLVDLDLQMGDASLFLDLRPAHTLAEVARGGAFDAAKLRSLLAPHASGLFLLGGPEHLDDADRLTPAQVGEVLSLLQTLFEYVIVDAGRAFDARPLEAVSAADAVLLVGTPSVPAARNLRLAADMLCELGLPRERLRLVLNRFTKRGGVSLQDLETTIGLPIAWRLAADDRLAHEAINTGEPAILRAPRSELCRGIQALVKDLETIQRAPRALPPAEAAA